MRVLYVTNSTAMAGDSVALLHLLEPLKRKGVELFVTYPCEGDFSSRLHELGIGGEAINAPLDIYPTLRSWVDYIKLPIRILKYLYQRKRALSRLESCIKTFQPDIIHTNIGPLHIGFEAARKHHIPHIWHIREYQKEDFGMLPFPSMKAFSRLVRDRANHCICITKDILEHFGLDEKKDHVIYDGVIDKTQKRDINHHKSDYILFAGRLEEAKGIKVLLEAYVDYIKSGGSLRLLVAGKGEEDYVQQCKAIVSSAGLEGKVDFLGQRTDVFDLMYNARIFVVPSLREGFGFITVEAMFNGTVVIGHDTGGTKEQFDNGVEETGHEIAFKYSVESELAGLLKKVEGISEERYDGIASQAQGVVCKLYDIESQAAKVYELYRKLLNIAP